MSISKNRKRTKKPLVAWSGSRTCNRGSVPTTSIFIVLTILLTGGGFVLIISPTLVASALVQEGITTISTTTGAALTPTNNTTTEMFPAPGIESSSSLPAQQNVSVSEIPVSEVNGTYMNPDIGFQIDLPTGWKGLEINFLIKSVFAAPGDTNLLESLVFQESSTYMTILGIDQESFNMLESNVSQSPALGGQEAGDGVGGQGGEGAAPGGEEEELTSQPQGSSSNPLGTNTTTAMTPFGDSTVSCTFSQPSFVTINGINAEESLGECSDGGQGGASGVGEVGTNAPKTKSYTFATQDNSLIVVGFFGNSTITYDQNLPLFEESVRTISISRPADIANSEIYNRYKELVESQQQLLSNQTGSGM
jgi:hypothetical protein